MNLGSEVISKRTGLPAYGTIVGIMDSDFYLNSKAPQGANYSRWDELYPNWKEKPVMFVYFKEPQKTLAFEEYAKGFETHQVEATLEEMKTLYKFLPKAPVAAYPIDDLECIEEAEIND